MRSQSVLPAINPSHARPRAGHARLSAPLAAKTKLARFFLGVALLWPCVVHAAPQRIVSLNLCTDELLLRLVEPARIVSVTWLARDAGASNVAERAAHVAVNHGSAEEVIPSAPDLVLIGEYTTASASALLRRTGFRVETLPLVRSFDEADRRIREFGAIVGAGPQADALAGSISAALAQQSAPEGLRPPRALVLNPNGFTAGPDTLADAVIAQAGLFNVARTLGSGHYGQLPLEKVAALDIEVLIISGNEQRGASLSTDLLHHPLLRHLASTMEIVTVPERRWGCAGPELVEALATLRRAGERARARAGAGH
jgi:iron complex transport system substrate-binding protein